MKKTTQLLLLAALLFTGFSLKAQNVIGIESPIKEKNILIGFKAGVTAMDMVYSQNATKPNQFVNHSVFYHHPSTEDLLKRCLTAGISIERTTPRFSYGVDLMASGLMAEKSASDSVFHIASSDVAYYIRFRVPVRLFLLHEKTFSPFVFVAPEISTYLPVSDPEFGGQSVWNGIPIHWVKDNAPIPNLNLLAGGGLNAKINLGDYQFWARLELAYNLGLTNTVNKEIIPKKEVVRKTRGWEATIGLSFPLFKNPSYHWLM